jgi:hypothetical protein
MLEQEQRDETAYQERIERYAEIVDAFRNALITYQHILRLKRGVRDVATKISMSATSFIDPGNIAGIFISIGLGEKIGEAVHGRSEDSSFERFLHAREIIQHELENAEGAADMFRDLGLTYEITDKGTYCFKVLVDH